jgi:DNA polymerase-3 subunit delta'
MVFSQIPGQQSAKNGLIKMHQTGRLPHAIMLAGAEGTGVLPMALALTKYLFCNNRTELDSCKVCAECIKVAKLEHADVHITFPVFRLKSDKPGLSRDFINDFRDFIKKTPFGNVQDWLQFSEADNKQGNISAAECEEIINNLNLKSYEGGLKVQIIWMPEYLEKEGNKLLKLIEEPPGGTVIIFAAENPQRVLPTILSRTQMVRLSPVPAADIADALVSKGLAETRVAAGIAAMAGGSYAEALRLLHHTEHDLFPDMRRWFNAMATRNAPELLKFVDEWAKSGREHIKGLLAYTIQMLEESLRVQYMPHMEPALATEEAGFVKKLAQRQLPQETVAAIIKHLASAIRNIGQNAHSKTQLLALSLRMQHLLANDFSLEQNPLLQTS